jgi:hypothetical protein
VSAVADLRSQLADVREWLDKHRFEGRDRDALWSRNFERAHRLHVELVRRTDPDLYRLLYAKGAL